MTILLFIFGLAIFLFAMHNLESGLRLASGAGLRTWIVSKTSTPLSSAACGVLVTAVLQSSSMVSLIVLAFVSAGVIPLYNGIGVVLGANLGTTMTGWLVTIVGFKMDLQAMVIPLLGIGAACRLGYIKNKRVAGFGKAVFAFGLLIFGLDIMKDSVSGLADVYDITAFADLPSWIYLFSGVFLAGVMQSSSAVMIIALSMLSSDMVQLNDAAAVVIGADLGTTSTTILGSIGKSLVKKQLALAQVIFNFLVDGLAFIFLLPVLPDLLNTLSISDPLFGLVAFHSAFNLLGLLIFLPLLKFYTLSIQRLLPIRDDKRKDYFNVPVQVPEAALDSLSLALRHLRSDALQLNLNELNIDTNEVSLSATLPTGLQGSFEGQYEALKVFEADFVRYAAKLRLTELSEEQSARVTQLLASARSLIYASKTLEDIRADYAQLADAINKTLGAALSESHHRFLVSLLKQINQMFFTQHDPSYVNEQLALLSERNGAHYQDVNTLVTQNMAQEGDGYLQASTWFNLNHELHHYTRYMLSSLNIDQSANVTSVQALDYS
ncbi:MAG: phosphate:Na+ symporter [Porticoccaceae bacterium]|jgi:phosphate:Na+ symporter